MWTNYIRRYPLSIIILCCIVGLSLYPFTEVQPLPDVPLADKWAHMVMYGGWCMVIWFEYLCKHSALKGLRIIIGGVIVPILVGGALEVMQEILTETRNGDWIDFYANTLGVMLGTMVGRFILVPLIKKYL